MKLKTLILKKKKIKRIVLLGLPGSGKTTFLAALLYDMTLNTKKYNEIKILLGKNSSSFLIRTLEKIKEGRTMDLLSDRISLHFEITAHDKKLEFELLDIGGELIELFGMIDFNLNNILRSKEVKDFIDILKNCSALLIFYDPAREGEELLKMSRGLNRIMIYLKETANVSRIPVAIIIPKCDLFPDIYNDPVSWLSKRDFLYAFLNKYFKNVKVFAVSAFGESTRLNDTWIPKNKELRPKGVFEVLQWIKENI